MKPRTKIEKEITGLSSRLSPINEKMLAWGQEHSLLYVASLCKGEAWCSGCGRTWIPVNEIGEKVKCPYCGRLLKVEKNRRKKFITEGYMTICRAFKGFQVLRHVWIERISFKENTEIFKYSREVCQQWFDNEGNETIIARPHNYGGQWMFSEEMSIKKRTGFYNWYDINGFVYPKSSFTPLLQKYGLRSSLHNLDAAELIRELLRQEPFTEMLLKTKQYGLLQYKMYRGGIGWFSKTINICNRNHYIVKDGEMYADYMYLLREFHLDLHNAYYVCPKDLKVAHDTLLKRKERREAELRKKHEWEESLRRKKMIKAGMRYYCSHIVPYMHLSFEGKGLTIRPLQSVSEFYQEAKNLHHCVWVCHYYDHKECLILTARKGNEVLETIEINTSTFKVIQVRGSWNKPSEYHDYIVNLVKKNMKLIKACAS